MSERSASTGLWTACPRCQGRAFVGFVEVPRRGLALGCGRCGAVTPVGDPAALGLSPADVRRLLRRDDGRYVDGLPVRRPRGAEAAA